MSNAHLFCFNLFFQHSHNRSESWEHIGYTWRSTLFQGSYEEVKLVLCMNKQPSRTYSSSGEFTEEPILVFYLSCCFFPRHKYTMSKLLAYSTVAHTHTHTYSLIMLARPLRLPALLCLSFSFFSPHLLMNGAQRRYNTTLREGAYSMCTWLICFIYSWKLQHQSRYSMKDEMPAMQMI